MRKGVAIDLIFNWMIVKFYSRIMSGERGGASEEIRNMILVSCFIGKINNIPIPNAFLEYLSKHSKDTYYRVRSELSKKNLIAIKGGHKNEYVELKEEGMRTLSRILIGKETSNLEWADVYEALRKELSFFGKWKIRAKESEENKKEENLSQALLLLYSESSGNRPEDYYRNLLRNLVREYRRSGAGRLKQVLLEKLDRLYDTSSTISQSKGKTDSENNATDVIFDFMIAVAEKINETCQKAEVALELWPRKKTAHLLGSIITSYDTIPKTYLLPAYLIMIFVASLLIIASVWPMIGWLLANLIAYGAGWLGAGSILIFLLGAITSGILRDRLSRKESEA